MSVNVRSLYDKLALEYDHRETFRSDTVLGKLQRLRMTQVLRYIPANKVVLDVGCGSSPILHAIARKSDVIGVDLSKRMLQRQREEGQTLNVSLVLGVGEQLPIRDHSIELATCLELVEHVADPNELLTEIVRTLKIDGQIIISTPNSLTNPYASGSIDHLRAYKLPELATLLSKFGNFSLVPFPVGPPLPTFVLRFLYRYGEKTLRKRSGARKPLIMRLIDNSVLWHLASRLWSFFPSLAFFLIARICVK